MISLLPNVIKRIARGMQAVNFGRNAERMRGLPGEDSIICWFSTGETEGHISKLFGKK
jgi:hypothetical protein